MSCLVIRDCSLNNLPICRLGSYAGIFAHSCGLLVALLRHHSEAVGRQAALLLASARKLLGVLAAWQNSGEAAAAACAEELSRVHTALAESKVGHEVR